MMIISTLPSEDENIYQCKSIESGFIRRKLQLIGTTMVFKHRRFAGTTAAIDSQKECQDFAT